MRITCLYLALALPLGSDALAQNWPAKPIAFIVPAPPGPANDTVARTLAPKLSEALGQPVVVVNRSGATGIIGFNAAARATPDGHTLLMAATSYTTNLYTTKGTPPLSEFNTVALIGRLPYTLMVSPHVTARNMKDFVTLLKTNRGKYNAATSGTTGASYFLLEAFKKAAGVEFEIVNYQGSTNSLLDLMEGRVHMLISPIATAVPQYKAGKMQVHGVTGPKRSAAIPDVPTFTEVGLAQMDVPGWMGIMVPAGVPRDVIARLNQTFNKALAAPDVIDRLNTLGIEPITGTPEEMNAFLRKDSAVWGKATADLGIKPQ